MGILQISLLTLLLSSSLAQGSSTTTNASPDPATASDTPQTSNPTAPSTAATDQTASSTIATNPTVSSTAATNPTAPSTAATNPTASSTAATNPTAPSTAATNTIPSSTATPTATTKDVCQPSSCPENSKCEELFNGIRCLCDGGFVYNENSCEKAKVFPGNLHLRQPYNDNMKDKTSVEFLNTSQNIVKALNKALREIEGYLSSVVISLRPATAITNRESSSPEVVADVENVFDLSAEITTQAITNAIKEAGQDGLLNNTVLENSDLCDRVTACVLPTANGCTSENNIAKCQCTENFAIVNPNQDIHCTVCPSGEKAEDGSCKGCSFGYTGINCGDNYLLIVVIVSIVLGLLLLTSMGVTTYSFLRKRKGKKDNDGNPGSNGLAFPNLGAQAKPSPFSMIPRAGGAGSMEMSSRMGSDGYSMPKKNNMNGNTPAGMGNNGGGVVGLRTQTGQSFNRGSNMSNRSTPTMAGMGNGDMGGLRTQPNQSRANDWGRPYEEPKHFALPRVGQGNQSQSNPYDRNPYNRNPYDDRRNPY